MTVAKSSLSK